ncbi:MAG: acetylglutamate kinase [Firmicutes bacterium]|nr:acetylglutamate kinase [Alicyclobacillaceae bacterium]MCL6498039.1 acetylglutamate kinase [Bacillota bacterium]
MLAVFKVGGSILAEAGQLWQEELEAWLREGRRAVVVHGGGAKVSAALERLGEPVEFLDGQRVTSPEALETVVAVLRGVVNLELVATLQARGVRAVGLSGVDGGSLTGAIRDPRLGRVGEVVAADPALWHQLLAFGMLPVIAPLIGDGRGGALNANGDLVAAAVAAALKADLLVFYTDSGGVRADPNDPATLVEVLDAPTARAWMAEGRARGGMVPKLEAALGALAGGVPEVRIGAWRRTPHTRVVAGLRGQEVQ